MAAFDIDAIPLILAGPILRRTEPVSVTVWVALKKTSKVQLKIFNENTQELFASPEQQTTKLGEHLYVTAVTATTTTPLQPGKSYYYNLFFDGADDLHTDNVLVATPATAEKLQRIAYDDKMLPSFVLPPDDLNDLRIVHASCRKPHGKGQDALEALDKMLEETAVNPLQRPHQLFLTGDQIYADDVADKLLEMLTTVGEILLNWKEKMPGVDKLLEELQPGKRAETAETHCGFTSDEAKSQLFGLAEFYAMYLFAWSDVLWHDTTFNTEEKDEARLQAFLKTIPNVRRALANVPTYMIFDDHEITDDWYLRRKWAVRVLGLPMGQRVLMNGLLAYAIFQAWGNTPSQFRVGGFGEELLTNATAWVNGGGDEQRMRELLGMPTAASVEADKRLTPHNDALEWHYTVPGNQYQVLILDTRTWRTFPGADYKPPGLISTEGFDRQIPETVPEDTQLIFVINATPVIGIPLVDSLQDALTLNWLYNVPILSIFPRRILGGTYTDYEAWRLQKKTVEQLFAKIATLLPQSNNAIQGRLIMLCGDVHYGFAVRLQYWAKKPFLETAVDTNVVMAQFTASSTKHQQGNTKLLHTIGYELDIFGNDLPDSVKRLGWHQTGSNEPKLIEEDVGEELEVDAEPDWLYRYDFLLAELENVPFDDLQPPSGNKMEKLKRYKEAADDHEDYAKKWGDGKEIVGVNNIGEITFTWNAGDKSASQKLWWRFEDEDDGPLLIAPLTEHVVSLELDEPNYPKPEYEVEGE